MRKLKPADASGLALSRELQMKHIHNTSFSVPEALLLLGAADLALAEFEPLFKPDITRCVTFSLATAAR
jgi:hypothetical protein